MQFRTLSVLHLHYSWLNFSWEYSWLNILDVNSVFHTCRTIYVDVRVEHGRSWKCWTRLHMNLDVQVDIILVQHYQSVHVQLGRPGRLFRPCSDLDAWIMNQFIDDLRQYFWKFWWIWIIQTWILKFLKNFDKFWNFENFKTVNFPKLIF